MKKKEASRIYYDILDQLIISLYTRQLQPGDKLPPLRKFAESLGVEPSSLRSVLKLLEVMNLLDIRRSDGAYVKDFKENGRLGFMTALFSNEKIREDENILDPFLLDEFLSFWSAVFPEIMFMAWKNYSPLDLKMLMDILDEQIANVDNVEKLAELDTVAQRSVAKLSNNLIVSLFLNSIAPMSSKITEMFYRNLKPKSRLRFLEIKKEGIYNLMTEKLDQRLSTELFRKEMEKCHKEIRKSVAENMR